MKPMDLRKRVDHLREEAGRLRRSASAQLATPTPRVLEFYEDEALGMDLAADYLSAKLEALEDDPDE